MTSSPRSTFIPEELRPDFDRQIEERINAEIMQRILISGNVCSTVEEVILEQELEAFFIDQYVTMYKTGSWPPKAGGVAADQAAKHQKWRCPNCEDKNFSTLTTCKKCGEPKPVTKEHHVNTVPRYTAPIPTAGVANIHPSGPVVVRDPNQPATLSWTCLECSYAKNPTKTTECIQCMHSRDPMKKDSWPVGITDIELRRTLRKEVFSRLVTAFGVDDPFTASHIPYGTFASAVECVQRAVLDEHKQQSACSS